MVSEWRATAEAKENRGRIACCAQSLCRTIPKLHSRASWVHLYDLPAFRALPLVFSFIVHYALKTLRLRRLFLSLRMTIKDVTEVMNNYPLSVIMLSFANLMSMFVPMIMIVKSTMCSVCILARILPIVAEPSFSL